MPYVFQAGFWVGCIGTVAAVPLLFLLRAQRAYMTIEQFYLTAPIAVFVMAAGFFALVYQLLPQGQQRARIAGIFTGLLTYFGFAVWLSIMISVHVNQYRQWSSVLAPMLMGFAAVGWIPVLGGWFAGWVVEKLPDAPVVEAQPAQ